MTIKTITLLLFFLFINIVFSQEKIIFNIKSTLDIKRLYKKNAPNEETLQTLRADVSTIHGNFSILLIDNNSNGEFLDYKKYINTGIDVITITDYKKNPTIYYHSNKRYLSPTFPISINGITFRIKDFVRESQFIYTATLVKEKIPLKEINKNRNGVLIDSLPNITLKTILNESVNLRKYLKKGTYLFVNFHSHAYPSEDELKNYRKLERTFHDLNRIIPIVIDNNRLISRKYALKIALIRESNILISDSKIQTLHKLGYNKSYPNGILFNDKGKVVMSNIDYVTFKKLLYKERQNKKNALN